MEETVEEEAPVELTYSRPSDCTALLNDAGAALLEAQGVELIAGPGSPSNDPIYVEGQTPEELVGGLSCLFAIPGKLTRASTSSWERLSWTMRSGHRD